MKLPVAILAASLAINAGLFAALKLQPTLAPASVRDYFAASRASVADSSTAAAAKKSAGSPAAKADAKSAWTKLETADLRDLVARLRAAGFPSDVIRAIVAAEIDARYRSRFKEIADQMWSREYWKSDSSGFMGNSKVQQQMNDLFRERSKLQRSLLGDEAFADAGDVSAEQRRRYGDLPKAKIDLVKQVEEDYQEMNQQLRTSMQGITLSEDRDKIALLEREKHADLAAILTPEELAEYDMRTSRVTMSLRGPLTIMDATEQEFRTIYEKAAAFKDILYPDAPTAGGMDWFQKRRDAQSQLNDQLKAALGDARYADYTRANDRDYQQLYRLMQRDGLPADNVKQAYALKDKVATESSRIYDDSALSAEDKRTALKTLAQNTRLELNNLLGQSAGDTFGKSATWLRYVDNGAAFSIGPDGSPSVRMVRPPMPPKG